MYIIAYCKCIVNIITNKNFTLIVRINRRIATIEWILMILASFKRRVLHLSIYTKIFKFALIDEKLH